MSPAPRVGELRPTQMLFTYGVGSIVDLPSISVIVMGLDDWNPVAQEPIQEPRLLAAVRRQLGPQVERLYLPPVKEDSGSALNPFDEEYLKGVPVAPFPRWMVCPACRRLAALSLGMFELKADLYRSDRTRYVHTHCPRAKKPPTVFPARFLFACPRGHVDDFPWLYFVHGKTSTCQGPLRLEETGPSGEARDVLVACDGCKAARAMTSAFGDQAAKHLPRCRARRIHLLDEEAAGCTEQPRTILVGASNLWFPSVHSVLSIPHAGDELERLVRDAWGDYLEHAQDMNALKILLKVPALRKLGGYAVEDIWEVIVRLRGGQPEQRFPEDLKIPEWEVFSNPVGAPQAENFRLREVRVPSGFETLLERVVLAERLREVRALTGFTRIESAVELTEGEKEIREFLAPLSRRPPTWVPASEVRGEGIFIEFSESAVKNWLASGVGLDARTEAFRTAHFKWRSLRGIEPPAAGFPGMPFILLHSFSHALMRRFSLECGYGAASLRERIYAGPGGAGGDPMAGVLLYTAAADSEGTLGGLVALGEPDQLGQHIRAALQDMKFCASDPLCSEHGPSPSGRTLHAACCHACLFSSETSCERGNRYLDRAVLIDTVGVSGQGFFTELVEIGAGVAGKVD